MQRGNGMEPSFPQLVVIEVQTDHRGEYTGSTRVAIFPSQSGAESGLAALPDDKRRDCLVVEERDERTYFLPDGRRFDPQLGGYLHKHL